MLVFTKKKLFMLDYATKVRLFFDLLLIFKIFAFFIFIFLKNLLPAVTKAVAI
ncbi:MAG: hypothetical protein RI894_1004 [Bacteroidota bacterium]|jgi:hypothetical protein